MKASTIGMWVAAWVSVSVLAYASGRAADGRYVAHGPGATAEFEAGLYQLHPSYARGVWPTPEVLAGGLEKDAIPQVQRSEVNAYVERVVPRKYRPFPDGTVRGLRAVYDKRDAILLSKKIDENLTVETTTTTTVLTVTFKSAKLFDWTPAQVTGASLLDKLGTLLVIPPEQLVQAQVTLAPAEVAGTTIVKGRVRIPSPPDAGEGLMGFRWYNQIDFWTVRGMLFVSVVPFEGAVAQPPEIKLDAPQN
jgi:hypothetical protein